MIYALAGTIYALIDGVPKAAEPVWLMKGKYGILRTPHRVKARGVMIDGKNYRLAGDPTLGDLPEAKLITRAEYDEALGLMEPDPDPELTPEEALNIIMGGKYETE